VSDRSVDLIGEWVDCMIRAGALPDSSRIARHLTDLAWLTCASPRYLQARGTPKHPSELLPAAAALGALAGHGVAGYFFSLSGRAAPYLQSGQLREVLADWSRPLTPLHLVHPGNRQLNAKLRVFVDWAIKIFAKMDVATHAEKSGNNRPQPLWTSLCPSRDQWRQVLVAVVFSLPCFRFEQGQLDTSLVRVRETADMMPMPSTIRQVMPMYSGAMPTATMPQATPATSSTSPIRKIANDMGNSFERRGQGTAWIAL